MATAAPEPGRLEAAAEHVAQLRGSLVVAAAGAGAAVGAAAAVPDMRPTAAAPTVVFKTRRRLGHAGGSRVHSVQWAGNSEDLVAASATDVAVWSATAGVLRQKMASRTAWSLCCCFEPQSDAYVACGGIDKVCSVYKIGASPQNRAYRELASHDGYVSCCTFVNGPGQLLTSSGDCSCILWDVARGMPVQHFHDHSNDVMGVAVSPTNPNVFVSGSCDASAKVWDVRAGRAVRTMAVHDSDINAVAFVGRSGTAFGTASDDATLTVFDTRSDSPLNRFRNDTLAVAAGGLSFSRSGRLMMGAYHDGVVRVWDTLDGGATAPLTQFAAHTERLTGVHVNPAGNAVASSSYDGTVAVSA